MKILHLMHRSVPGTHGYAIRSLEIVKNQLACGLEPVVITSPSQAPLGNLDAQQSEVIGGVRYFRTCSALLPATLEVQDSSPVRSFMRVGQNFFLFTKALDVARRLRPAVIHAHSPFTCGIIANMAGRILGIPTVYEVRGIWEDSHTGRFGLSSRSFRYRGVRVLENRALHGADLCCVIGDSLRDEVISRGVAANKIRVVPNGVDVKSFEPSPPDSELQKRLGLEGKTVTGYIGSFFRYEGLDQLVKASAILAEEYPDLRLLMVGDGEMMPILRDEATKAGISDRVVFTGRVPHDKIADFYRLYDFMVLPRRDTRETRLVTPLKPLEIMAMEKPLILSDIGGHREIVEEGINGTFFRAEDTTDLAAKCRILMTDQDYARNLGLKGRRWVESNRDWAILVRRYLDAYQSLVNSITYNA